MKLKVVFDGNSVELYVGRLRIELWARLIESMSGVVVYVLPSLALRGSIDIIGVITHLDWLIFQVGLSIRWMRDGDVV